MSVSSGAILDVSAVAAVGSIASVSGATIDISSDSLTAGADNSSTVIAGLLTGSGDLTKAGTGILTMSGTTSSFTGGLNISAGEVLVSNALALTSSNAVIMTGSSTLDLNASLTIGDLTGGVNNELDLVAGSV